MVRNVRNFWIEAEIDGRSARLQGGPASSDGGFSLRVMMRDEGSIVRALSVSGWAHSGELRLEVEPVDVTPAAVWPAGEVEGAGGFRIGTTR
jgi:hypothetical protein